MSTIKFSKTLFDNLYIFSSPKRNTKRALQLCRPFGLPCVSLCCRDGKKLARIQRTQTVLPSCSDNSCDTQRYRMGSQPENFIFLPFHAAEQHSKERISDSAQSDAVEPRKRLPFLVRFWASKMNPIKTILFILYLLLLFAQKKEQEKGPRLYRPFGLSCASRC